MVTRMQPGSQQEGERRVGALEDEVSGATKELRANIDDGGSF